MAETSAEAARGTDPYAELLPPSVDHLHFSALAIEYEIETLAALGFNLYLGGATIGTVPPDKAADGGDIAMRIGLDERGQLAPEALEALGAQDVRALWRDEVPKKAEELVSEGRLESGLARLQDAQHNLEQAVCNLQMEVLLLRERGDKYWSPQQSAEARARIRALGSEKVLGEVRRDDEDFSALKRDEDLAVKRLEELLAIDPDSLTHRVCLWNALQGVERLLEQATKEASPPGGENAADEDDKFRNWRHPKDDLDFAAQAGKAEKEALDALKFTLEFDGFRIGEKKPGGQELHGVDCKGYLTHRALQTLGVGSYTRLWRWNGKVADAARSLLSGGRGTLEERMRVEEAIRGLVLSVVNRQMDLMTFRAKGKQHWQAWQWEKSKQRIMKEFDEDEAAIMAEVWRDECERAEMRRGGGSLPFERRKELESDCPSHVFQLGLRLETLKALQQLVV